MMSSIFVPGAPPLNIPVRINDVGSLRLALDSACEELGIEMQSLDVPTRDRLIERILALLGTAR
jgi:hypothetical protein